MLTLKIGGNVTGARRVPTSYPPPSVDVSDTFSSSHHKVVISISLFTSQYLKWWFYQHEIECYRILFQGGDTSCQVCVVSDRTGTCQIQILPVKFEGGVDERGGGRGGGIEGTIYETLTNLHPPPYNNPHNSILTLVNTSLRARGLIFGILTTDIPTVP